MASLTHPRVPPARAGQPRGRRGRRPATRRARTQTYVALVVAVAVSVFPFYWMFVVASNSNAVMNQVPPRVVPGPNFLANVRLVFESVPFARALANSLLVAGSITVSVVFLSTLAGFAFAKLPFRGRGVLFGVVVATLMVPQQLGLIPLYMLMTRFGWVNDLKAVVVPTLVTAFGVFWMRQYVGGAVHDELLDAARIDGCSTFGLFRHVVAPAVRPGAAVLAMFTFLFAWNDFLWPLVVLQDQDVHTIQIALRTLNDAYYTDFSMVMAGTLLGVLPTVVVFLLFSRQMIAGLSEGAVKL
jgi:cellobiose transport system permease protein